MNYYDLNLFERRLNRLFPNINAEEWDNVGLQIASENIIIKKVLITLDLNLQIFEYAKNNNFNLIISHHPLIFQGLKNIIAYNNLKNRLIKEFLISKIGLYILHTNLDKYFYKLLSERLKLRKIKALSEKGFGSYGFLPNPFSLLELIKYIKKELKMEYLRYTGNDSKKIKTVACIGGTGNSFINNMLKEKKIDALITSDIKYHTAQLSDELEIPVIDAGHYFTENIMMPVLKLKLEKAFKKKIIFEINKINTDPFKFY